MSPPIIHRDFTIERAYPATASYGRLRRARG